MKRKSFFKINKDKRGCRFILDTRSCNAVYISYKQKLFENYARYILLSTQSWGEVLKRVEYKLKISDHIRITYFSIEPDGEICLDFGRLYLWQRENFMPDRDLIFEFQMK